MCYMTIGLPIPYEIVPPLRAKMSSNQAINQKWCGVRVKDPKDSFLGSKLHMEGFKINSSTSELKVSKNTPFKA